MTPNRRGRMASYIGRRKFVATLGGAAAVAWPLAASAQQTERVRRIGVLTAATPADDPDWPAPPPAFLQRLQQLGWIDRRNVRLDYRWGLGDPTNIRKYAAELVA